MFLTEISSAVSGKLFNLLSLKCQTSKLFTEIIGKHPTTEPHSWPISDFSIVSKLARYKL